MKPWTRNDTRDWMFQVEHRLEDINYYLDDCYRWCINNDVYDYKMVFACAFTTCIWVCNQRNESISYVELLEILQKEELHDASSTDKVYQVCPSYAALEHEELLALVIKMF